MKKLIVIFILAFSNFTGYSHSDTTSKEGANRLTFGTNISYFTALELYFNDGFAFATSFVIIKQKHSLFIGPVWWFDKNQDVSMFRGGMVSYQYFPRKDRGRINFFFIYDLVYTSEKNQWDTLMHFYPMLPINQVYDVTVTTKWQSMINQVGYGFNLNIYKGFYLNQSFSLGIEFYNYKSKADVKDDPGLSSEYSTGSIFSGSNANSVLKIGFGYNC